MYLTIKECIGNCFKVIHWFILKIGLERKAEMGKHVGTMVLVNIFYNLISNVTLVPKFKSLAHYKQIWKKSHKNEFQGERIEY